LVASSGICEYNILAFIFYVPVTTFLNKPTGETAESISTRNVSKRVVPREVYCIPLGVKILTS